MSIEEFWYGNPKWLGNYVSAHNRRQQDFDQQAWLIGAYVKQAIQSSVAPTMLLLDSKALDKLPKYPNSPMSNEENTANGLSAEEYAQRSRDIERIRMLNNIYLQQINKKR